MGAIAVLPSSGDNVEKIAPLAAAIPAVVGAVAPTAAAVAPAAAVTAGSLAAAAPAAAATTATAAAAPAAVAPAAADVGTSLGSKALNAGKRLLTGDSEDKSKLQQVGEGLNAQKNRDADARNQQVQGATDAARRGAEITAGTTKGIPMNHSWALLKNRMEVGPHDEQQDELFNHLKNLSGDHRIRTNEDDNSFMLDDVHDADRDIVRRLIEGFGRKFTNEDEPHMADMKDEEHPHFF